MKRILTAAFCVGLAGASFSHGRPGYLWFAWEWPPGYEPVLDGDLSEWEIVDDMYRISFSHSLDPDGNSPTDFNDLNSEIIVSWSECENKLYVAETRRDDFYDRDGNGRDDILELHLDGDHGGEQFWFSEEDYPDPDERALNMGRYAQTIATRFPNLPGSTGPGGETWAWFWVSQSTWHDQPEYMDWAFSFEGQMQGEATLYIEFSTVLWDEFIWNDPDGSVQTDLESDNIIGLGWTYEDRDRSGDEESVEYWFLSDDTNARKTSASAPDFLLIPHDPHGGSQNCPEAETAVESQSWGRIKEAFIAPR